MNITTNIYLAQATWSKQLFSTAKIYCLFHCQKAIQFKNVKILRDDVIMVAEQLVPICEDWSNEAGGRRGE